MEAAVMDLLGGGYAVSHELMTQSIYHPTRSELSATLSHRPPHD